MPKAGPDDFFYVAPFALNGELVGIGKWQVSSLSRKWLDFCASVLQNRGTVFEDSLPSPLERISMRLTSANTTALATFSLDGSPVGSSAYLRGINLAAEQEVLQPFVESLRRVEIVGKTQTSHQPFAEVLTISERPLHIAVAWDGLGQDAAIIPELATHFAGVFLFQ